MAREYVRLEGSRELNQALTDLRESMDLSRATTKNTVKRAMVDAAEPFRKDAASRAPFLRGDLRESFATGTKLSRRQKSQHRKESELEIFVGPGALPQAITQEFGTSHHAPRPSLRPAWDSNRFDVLKRFSGSLWKQIEKTAERARRKAAKVAAKVGR